ncbi:MAG TPA: TonB family protein [Trinickia sp.]|uniref:energy transducer TonB family protein n=1 Tax=Trinickia sp. TaxID=2571163 RepID=UPI002C18B0E3|nr:TonB family protein [Trinickia sp.]HVW50065.1 TonB family protein [Trinickia sp.]
MKKTTCSIAALILAGCASAGRIGDLPAVTDGSASTTLVLIRPSNVIGMTNSYYVAFDGKDVFSIRSGENTHFAIPAGSHTIAVKCFGGWSPTWKEDGKAFVAERGGITYFSISPSMTCSKIEPVSEADGKALLARTTFVDSTNSSNKETPSGPGSSQCPVQLRHGIREPVCASQALSPTVAQLPAPQLSRPAAERSTGPAVSAAPSSLRSHTQTITKVVAGQQVVCEVPLAGSTGETRQQRQSATTIVRITISPPSTVKQVTLAESSGNTALDAEAMKAAVGTVCSGLERRIAFLQSYEFGPSTAPAANR